MAKRINHETERHAEALRYYIGLGPGRKIIDVARKFGVSAVSAQTWASSHDWRRRAAEHDHGIGKLAREIADRDAIGHPVQDHSINGRIFQFTKDELAKAVVDGIMTRMGIEEPKQVEMNYPPKAWRFTVPGSPKTKRGAAPGRFGQMHSNSQTVAYEQMVAGAAIESGLSAGKGPCEVKIEIVLPTRRRKDADRVTSAVFDGLKRAGKSALEDDNLCVVQRLVVELVAVDPVCPSATVTVTMLEHDRSQPRERSETAAALSRSHMAATDFPE